jgi:hypothetical protein
LTRVNAFRVFAPGFVNEAKGGTLGSALAKMGYYSLGKNKEATANRLGRIIERAYRVAGRDPSRLTVSALNGLANRLQLKLLITCDGLPGGDPPSRCGQAAIDTEAKELVERWLAERGPTAP